MKFNFRFFDDSIDMHACEPYRLHNVSLSNAEIVTDPAFQLERPEINPKIERYN